MRFTFASQSDPAGRYLVGVRDSHDDNGGVLESNPHLNSIDNPEEAIASLADVLGYEVTLQPKRMTVTKIGQLFTVDPRGFKYLAIGVKERYDGVTVVSCLEAEGGADGILGGTPVQLFDQKDTHVVGQQWEVTEL